jgi:hypothetical protein
MRILAALLLTLALALPASAQEYAIDLGGSASFTTQGGDLYEDQDGGRRTTLLVNPTALYFVAPGFAIGGEAFISRRGQGGGSTTSLGIGPSIAYFIGGPDSSAYPFFSASGFISSTEFSGVSQTGLGGQFSGGVAIKLSRSVALTGSTFLLIESVDFSNEFGDSASISGNTFGFELGVTAFIF